MVWLQRVLDSSYILSATSFYFKSLYNEENKCTCYEVVVWFVSERLINS